LKIVDRKGSTDYFASLKTKLRDCPGLLEVSCNPVTASVLLVHDLATPLEAILARAEALGLFRVVAPQPAQQPVVSMPGASIGTLASRGVELLNGGLSGASQGRLDLPSIYFLGFLGLGVRELARGHVMPPALTLLWRSVQILQKLAQDAKG
jgi:hypothetical protein